MSKQTPPLRKGDIIQSSDFVYGTREYIRNGHMGETIWIGEAECRRRYAYVKNGESIPYNPQSISESRANARFVVEYANFEGGSSPTARDWYPDALMIQARRLRFDGTYDPHGELIAFHTMTTSHEHTVDFKDIKIVGKLEYWRELELESEQPTARKRARRRRTLMSERDQQLAALAVALCAFVEEYQLPSGHWRLSVFIHGANRVFDRDIKSDNMILEHIRQMFLLSGMSETEPKPPPIMIYREAIDSK